MPPAIIAESNSETSNPLLTLSSVRPKCRTHGAINALATGERNRSLSTSRAVCMNSAANGARPSLPDPIRSPINIRASFEAKFSVNRGKTLCAYFPKSPMRSANARPSPGLSRSNSAVLVSRSLDRTAELPSGSTTPVGRSVLRYSSPRARRSVSSSLYAWEVRKSG